MKRKKSLSYLGFAKKAGDAVSGFGTCEIKGKKHELKLLIIAEDTADNTREKTIAMAERLNIPWIEYEKGEELSHIIGTSGRYVFGITDKHFAKVITKAIEEEKK